MAALVTGFDAFDGAPFNPSGAVAERVQGCAAAVLPTSYEKSVAALDRLLAEHRPSRLVMLGLNSLIDKPMLERFALNIDDCTKPDNDGDIRRGTPIAADAPAALQTPFDVAGLAKRLGAEGFAVGVSNHAGAFVCNHVYFAALLTHAAVPGLFMHIPPVDAGDDTTLDRLADLTAALLRL